MPTKNIKTLNIVLIRYSNNIIVNCNKLLRHYNNMFRMVYILLYI